MKDVMWNGRLEGTIHLDSITDKDHLFGLGPVELLTGEILVMDGKAYRSRVASDTTMEVVETFDLRAPFFGYAIIPKWKEHPFPDHLRTLAQLEDYLNQEVQNAPLFFKLEGRVKDASIHVVNLPEGSRVRSPEEAHVGLTNYALRDTPVEILGFYSTKHKAIFTHHDTNMHLHLITKDRKKMGHLDAVVFEKGSMKLYLPDE